MEKRCTCENVGYGTYANQKAVTTPEGRLVGIDRCILPEVLSLWGQGVETLESCCGHQKAPGYIAVTAEHEQAMEQLGFVRDPRTKAPGCFLWPRA